MSRRLPKRPPDPPRPAPPSPQRAPLKTVAVAGAVLLVAIGVFVVSRGRTHDVSALLPSPPQVSSQQKAVEQHLRERYDAAMREPSSIAAVGALCLAYHADMFFNEADRCYDAAGRLAPGDWRWTYYRAVIQSERGGGEALVANLRRVVERGPQFGPAWLRLGEAEFKAGQYDRAADAWRRARDLPVESDPSVSPRHLTEIPLAAYASLGLARVALVRGEFDSARETLEQLVGSTPQFGSALRLLAESYRKLGRETEAARFVYRAGRVPPYAPYADPVIDELARESRNSILLLRLASEANLAINAEWSEYLTRRALEFDPNNPEVVLKLARILRTVERNEEALELFMRYQAMVPGDYQALGHIGSCLSAMGRFEEAETYIRQALRGLDDPVTHFNLGLLLARTNRVDGAIAEYEKALKLDPMHSDSRTNLAAALARQGKLDRAAHELAVLLEHDPENAGARTNLGLVLLQQGLPTGAVTQFEEALRLDPGFTPAREALDSLRHQ